MFKSSFAVEDFGQIVSRELTIILSSCSHEKESIEANYT